jgi:hypothetical protein
MEVGGGGLGEDIGIGPITTTQVGLLILVSQLFIQGYHQIGGMITEAIVGGDVSGIINTFLINKFHNIGKELDTK